MLKRVQPLKSFFFIAMFALIGLTFSACYSLRGVSIDPETKTYSVNLFTNATQLAPPTLAQTFTQDFKDKIRNNTRLTLINTEGADLTFSGQVVGYDVSSVSPQPNQPAQFNQLRIAIEVELVDAKNEKGSWKQTFTFQADFPGNGQLFDFQDQLIKTITKKLLEDIFNKAFTENW
jgi:hypothetical protein